MSYPIQERALFLLVLSRPDPWKFFDLKVEFGEDLQPALSRLVAGGLLIAAGGRVSVPGAVRRAAELVEET